MIGRVIAVKEFNLGKETVQIGEILDGCIVCEQWAKIFHHTGWWQIPVEYIREE